jgi:hypothetical protein
MMSVIATTGGANFSHGIHKTSSKLQQTQASRASPRLAATHCVARDTGSPDASTIVAICSTGAQTGGYRTGPEAHRGAGRRCITATAGWRDSRCRTGFDLPSTRGAAEMRGTGVLESGSRAPPHTLRRVADRMLVRSTSRSRTGRSGQRHARECRYRAWTRHSWRHLGRAFCAPLNGA